MSSMLHDANAWRSKHQQAKARTDLELKLQAASSMLSVSAPTLVAAGGKSFSDYLISRSEFEVSNVSLVEVLSFRCRESKEQKKDKTRRRTPCK